MNKWVCIIDKVWYLYFCNSLFRHSRFFGVTCAPSQAVSSVMLIQIFNACRCSSKKSGGWKGNSYTICNRKKVYIDESNTKKRLFRVLYLIEFVSCSAKHRDSLDRDIASENRQANDFIILVCLTAFAIHRSLNSY